MGFEYRKAHDSEMPLIIDLLKRNFDTQLSEHLSGRDILNFYRSIQFDSFAFRKENAVIYVAKDITLKKLAGVIEICKNGELFLFFVDETYQGQGIGRRLLKLAELEITANYIDLTKLNVKSPVLTVAIYKRLGFQITNHSFTNLGIVFVEMEKRINCRVL